MRVGRVAQMDRCEHGVHIDLGCDECLYEEISALEHENDTLKEEVRILYEAAAANVVTRAQLADDLSDARRLVRHADRMTKEVGCLHRNSGNTEALRLASRGYDAERRGVDIGPKPGQVTDGRDQWERGPGKGTE